MKLVEQHIIKKSHPNYQDLNKISFLTKNLYNAGLYAVRQHYFKTHKFLNYYNLQKQFQNEHNVDYYALPTKVSQQILKLVEQNFKSFFSKLKTRKKGERVKIPKYLKKDGKFCIIYTNQTFSKPELRNKIIKPTKLNLKIKTDRINIQQLRIIPKNHHFVAEVTYNQQIEKIKENNNRYCSIDLGINNLATVGSNVIKPMIINGKPLKSINQYYNKKLSSLKSNLEKNEKQKTSNRIKSLNFKRNNKIKDYLHKSSRIIVNHLVSNNINTLVIGYNKNWKQDINIGKVNNQKFVFIPHFNLINMVKYKCEMNGINVILNEESYTSKCSFLDDEEICKHEKYLGKE